MCIHFLGHLIYMYICIYIYIYVRVCMYVYMYVSILAILRTYVFDRIPLIFSVWTKWYILMSTQELWCHKNVISHAKHFLYSVVVFLTCALRWFLYIFWHAHYVDFCIFLIMYLFVLLFTVFFFFFFQFSFFLSMNNRNAFLYPYERQSFHISQRTFTTDTRIAINCRFLKNIHLEN